MQGLTQIESYAAVFLAALISATLQLGLGCLLLLYHASLGKHIPKKTKKLASSFTMGFAVMAILLLASITFIIGNTVKTLKPEIMGGLVGALVALAILAWLFYYRRDEKTGKMTLRDRILNKLTADTTTELWIPRPIAKTLSARARKTESNPEAFSLGLLACFAELPFTFVLFIIAAGAIITLKPLEQLLAVILFATITLLPLVILSIALKHSKTVVEVQKWRAQNKNFLRLISGLGYLALGLFLWAFKVLGGAA